jgi:putative component of toxin-antitoxin plasmid stabilization module
MSFVVHEHAEFSDWLEALTDIVLRAKVARRLKNIEGGNLGD